MGDGRSGMRISEVVLRTTRYELMRDWYTQLLGAGPVTEAPLPKNPQVIRLAFFRLHVDYPYTQVLALFHVRGADGPPSATRGLDHVQLRHGSMEDLFDRYERLAALGVRPHRTMNHGPGTSFYYHDPDGNTVELSAANFPSAEEYLAFMASPAFAANPSGIAIDAEQYVARYRRGTPIRELVRLP